MHCSIIPATTWRNAPLNDALTALGVQVGKLANLHTLAGVDALVQDSLHDALVKLIALASQDPGVILKTLLALDERQQQPFEPLILALRALQDRSVLYQIAREKRDLVLDVMARISGTTDSPAR